MEAQVADELRTDMGEVVSPSEELFNLAVQGLLMLGQSQVQLPTHRMPHDMHASNDVYIERTELDQPRGGSYGEGAPGSDDLVPLGTRNITTEGSQEREDILRENPLTQHTQETTGTSHILDSPGNGSVQRQERPRGRTYGVGIPGIAKLAGHDISRVPVTQPPGMKDPPWLLRPPTGHPSWQVVDTKQATYTGYEASLADTGARTSSVSSDVCGKLGLEHDDHLPTEMIVNGATGHPLDMKGAILAKIQVGQVSTCQMMYIADNTIGSVLSRKALIDSGIISKNFPYQQQIPAHEELRRSFDSTMESEAAQVTTAWNEMAMPDWGNVPKRTRSEKLAARLEGLRGQKRKAKHLGPQNFASVAMDEDKDVPAALHDPRSLHRE